MAHAGRSFAHADFTAQSALRRATEVVGPAVRSARRLVALNLWRPIAEPVRDSPLAICSSASVAAGDLVPAELRYTDRTEDLLSCNARHRWLYAPEMRTSNSGCSRIPTATRPALRADTIRRSRMPMRRLPRPRRASKSGRLRSLSDCGIHRQDLRPGVRIEQRTCFAP
jgi:hypothetical protein